MFCRGQGFHNLFSRVLYSPYLSSWFSFVLYWQCLPHQLITNICRSYITHICSNSITNICCSSITNTYVVVELLIYIYCITNLGCSSITSICCIALPWQHWDCPGAIASKSGFQLSNRHSLASGGGKKKFFQA